MKRFYNNGKLCHLYEEGQQPINWKLGKLVYADLATLNYDEIINYYQLHTQQEVCFTYNINTHQLDKICKSVGFYKSQNLTVETRKRHLKELYGVENVFQLETVINDSKQTKIQKHGTLQNAYKARNQKTIKTLQEKTGNSAITNVFQLDDVKKKIIETTAANYNGDINLARSIASKKGSDTKEKLYGYRGVEQTPELEHKKHKKYFYENIMFDSSYELAIWIYAKDHNEEIIRGEGVPSFKYYYNNKQHWYHPDFLYKNELLEIKSSYQYHDGVLYATYGITTRTNEEQINMSNLYKAKLQCILDNKVKIWVETDCKFAIDYCIYKYNSKKWYLQFKLKEGNTNEN